MKDAANNTTVTPASIHLAVLGPRIAWIMAGVVARSEQGDHTLFVAEVLFLLAVVAGVAMWSVPAALILAGVLGVLAVEREQGRRKGTAS